jgi:alkylated DNA nucleotide flippase Atl1
MRIVVAAVVAVVLWSSTVPVRAWGLDVHRWITERAVDGLPVELRSYFGARRAFIAEHSVDPDLWRIADLTSAWGDEPPNHFLDIDGLGEPRPFRNVPRDWDAYVKKYGADRANQMGRLPWRAQEIYDKLVAAFRDVAKGQAYGAGNAAYLSAVLAHYLEDAHQPFHGVVNYDGQATGQRGIHSRYETSLVLRYRDALRLQPVRIRPVAGVKDLVFDVLIEGEALVEGILAADRAAAKKSGLFDDAYYAAFLEPARPVLERRLSEAASTVASVIVAAWAEAGKPAMPGRGSGGVTPAR